MTDIQRSMMLVLSALAILLVVLILRSTGRQVDKVRPVDAKLSFDATLACDKAKILAAQFPERGTGTKESRAAADWIESQMKKVRLTTERQEFVAWIAGKQVTGQNVVGTRRGSLDETIIVVAHYDIPYHVREGAMDNASGIGVLLELGRIFARERQTPRKTLVFIASDAEEWGMLGARYYAQTCPEPEQIRAVISLDLLRLENDKRVGIHCDGQFGGQTPAWLWMLAEDCITKVGGESVSDTTLEEFLSQAVNISGTDQGPFLKEDIPAVNLGGDLPSSPLGLKVYHTVNDTIENLTPEIFDVWGKSAELMIRSLLALDRSTEYHPYYLRTGRHTVVGRGGLIAMQIILFMPLLFATCFLYYDLRLRRDPTSEVLLEVANLLFFIAPWALALIVLRALVLKNIIPQYELYPATPLDPFLSRPVWTAVAAVATAAAAGWVGVWFVRKALSLSGKVDFTVSRAVCLDLLFTLGIVTIIVNGFAAVFFLAPAALLWSWIDAGRTPERIIVNFALLLAGTVPVILLTVSLALNMKLGFYALWFLMLGAGYGFLSPLTVMLVAGAGTVGVRLVQQSLRPVAVSIEEPAAENTEAQIE